MVRDLAPGDRAPALQVVLDALDDAGCRAIVRILEEPLSAKEVSDRCDIPLTTTYRKLEMLCSASLVQEQTEIRSDGHHTMRYQTDFEVLRVALNDHREFDVSVTRPVQSADERLERLWSEVRREA